MADSSVRYPTEMQLIRLNNRVISKWRLYAARLFLIFVVVSVPQSLGGYETPAGLVGGIIGTLLAAIAIVYMIYWGLSRPMTDTEQDHLQPAEPEETTVDECADCEMNLPPMVNECPKCGWEPN